jgi:putative LysE/RhtB family amino acid efflux pump
MARAFGLGLLVGFPIAASPGPMFFLVLRRTLARGWRSGLASGLGVATGDAIYAAIAAFGVVAVINILISQRRWIGLVGGIAIVLIGVHGIGVHIPPPRPSPQGGGRNYSVTGPPQGGERNYSGTDPPRGGGRNYSVTDPPRGGGRNYSVADPPQGGGGDYSVPDPPHKGEGTFRDYVSTIGLTLSNPPTILSFLAVFAGLGVHVGTGWQPAVALVAGVTLGSALWWVLLTALIAIARRRISASLTRTIAVIAGVALIVFGGLITLQAL